MPHDIAGTRVEAFRRDGYLTGIRVKSRADAAAVRGAWEAFEAQEGFEAAGYSTEHSRHLDRQWVWDLAVDEGILDIVESLIGPDILLFGTRFFCKYGPDYNYRVSWHQDIDSWGLEPPVALTVWYAIDRSDEENGCMQVIPGSHRAALREHDTTTLEDGNLLGRGQHLVVDSAEAARARSIVLEPGEISVHDAAVVHASVPNGSTRRRCGLAIRYVPTHVRQVRELAKSPLSKAILVRGHDEQRHFGVHPQPFV